MKETRSTRLAIVIKYLWVRKIRKLNSKGRSIDSACNLYGVDRTNYYRFEKGRGLKTNDTKHAFLKRILKKSFGETKFCGITYELFKRQHHADFLAHRRARENKIYAENSERRERLLAQQKSYKDREWYSGMIKRRRNYCKTEEYRDKKSLYDFKQYYGEERGEIYHLANKIYKEGKKK